MSSQHFDAIAQIAKDKLAQMRESKTLSMTIAPELYASPIDDVHYAGSIAEQKLNKLRARNNMEIPTLREFLIDAWKQVLHPSEELQIEGAWYIDLICEWLTVLTCGTLVRLGDRKTVEKLLNPYGITVAELPAKVIEAKQLLINVSPRCSKSTIVTVCWPCWEWIIMPWLPFMCMSYDQGLATDHSDDRRKIITSGWFQQISGGMELSQSKNRVTEFQNSSQGQMVARGLNAGVTGGGGLRIICDDGNDPNKVESDPVRKRASKAFQDYSITRRNDPNKTVVVNVQQRTHDRDISGEILDHPEEWVTVIIPMEAETHERIEFPLSKRVIERIPGDLMHPERFGPEIIAALKRNKRIWAGRYQQRPTLSGGGMFKIADWRLYADLPTIDRTIISVDASFKDLDDSDFVVVGLVGQRCNVRTTLTLEGDVVYEHEYYIPYRWRGKAALTETERVIKETADRFPEAYIKLVEDKANGTAIIDRMSSVLQGITAFSPGTNSKIARAAAVQPIQERCDVLLPIAEWAKPTLKALGRESITIGEWWQLYAPPHQSNAEHAPVDDWVKEYIDELALFPNAGNDDQVDMTSQSLIWLESQPDLDGWFGFSAESTDPTTSSYDLNLYQPESSSEFPR